MAKPAGPSAFEGAVEVVRTIVPDDLGPFKAGGHRWGMKLWFGQQPVVPKFHYEAQLLGGKHVGKGVTVAIEVGFHAEHADDGENERLLAGLVAAEKKWRKALGPDAVAGPFLGRASWRRLSETWIDPDLGQPELGFEVAARLVDYAAALEPILRALPPPDRV
ncbi:MAG: hypothetical protein H0W25_14205 [Acidimicrobiia bacterium]|nr:hypothetical protein [Acidimicrobiia bacterium]